MTGILDDLNHALRVYRGTPVSSLTAVAVLAIAMACVNTFLSLYVDLALRPHPGFEQSSRIATVGQNSGTSVIGMPYEVVERIANEMTSIEAAAAVRSTTTLVGSERQELVTGMVSREFFSGLRPNLAFGRGFRIEDHAPDAEPVMVLSYRFWQQQFDGNRNILGTVVEVTRDPTQQYQGPPSAAFSQVEPEEESAQIRIVGVMAETLRNLASMEPAIWVPLERSWPLFVGVPESLPPTPSSTYVRRASGVSATVVARELVARYDGPDSFPSRVPGAQLDAIEGVVSNFAVQRNAKHQIELFLAASLMVALVAAANVSLSLLVRAPGRRRELGVRMAVGAPIKRLARQLATEASILAIVSGVLGIVGSIWLSAYLQGLALLRNAEWRDVSPIDWRVLTLSCAVLAMLTMFVSLAPILGLKRLGIAASSSRATMRASRVQRVASTVQIVAAGMLASAAIALGWYLGSLLVNSAYNIEDLYVLDGGTDVVGLNRQQIFVEFARRRDAIGAIPGVTAVAFGSPVPGAVNEGLFPVRIPHPLDSTNVIEAHLGSVDSDFIELLDLALVHGRAPEGSETSGVLVNQTLARALWGRDDVVGERLPGNIRWGFEGADVLGVLHDLSFEHPSATALPYVFPTLGSPAVPVSIVIEANLTAAQLHEELDRITAIGALDVPVRNVLSLKAMRNELIAADRARTKLAMASAGLVIFLAAFGFYGTQRYLVTAGRREYAIRACLGAGPRSLRRLVQRRGLLLGAPGILIGSLLAFIVVAAMRGSFVTREVSPGIVTLCVAAGLVIVVLAAGYGPARQAERTQPARLLRED